MRSKTEEWGLGLPDFNEAQEVAEKPKTGILEELKFHADLWDDNEDQEMSVFFVRCIGEIRGLREKLICLEAFNSGAQQQAVDNEVVLRRELAESQAREMVMRDALVLAKIQGSKKDRDRIIDEANVMPYDDTALKAMLKKERERIAKHFDGKGEMFGDTVTDEIRALGD